VKLLPKESEEEEEEGELPPEEVVAVDALSLVRFGLRRADDPRIVNTVRAIDALLMTETSVAPSGTDTAAIGLVSTTTGDRFRRRTRDGGARGRC